VGWFDDPQGVQACLAAWYLRTLEEVRERIGHGRLGRQAGQGMVEYALILVLIAIVVILILATVGKLFKNVFSNVCNGLGS
jgi:pilus assembly protein Flp/PilA